MWAQYNYYVMILNTPGATSGKSTLIERFVTGTFRIADPTIEDFYKKTAVVDGEECVLEILDTGSTEQFTTINKTYVSNGDGFLLVFSVNNRALFEGEFHQNLQNLQKLAKDKPIVCESHLLIHTD